MFPACCTLATLHIDRVASKKPYPGAQPLAGCRLKRQNKKL